MNKADWLAREVEMSQPLPTLMAAQRTQCTINSNRPHSDNSQLWTAGRCQRLLRPITSRIELLRKDPIRYTAAGIPDSIQTRTTPAIAPTNVPAKNSREGEGKDAYWARGKKRVRRTYSAQSKLQDVSRADEMRGNLEEKNQGHKVKLQPGEFLVPTPILKRSKSLVVDSGRTLLADLSLTAPPKTKIVKRPRSRYATKAREAHYELAETMRQISKTTNAARFKVYEGIYNSLEALLKTILHDEQELLSAYDTRMRQLYTSSLASKVPRSRSLFSMCLRRVPNHIKEEERRFAIEAEEMGQKSAFDTRVISTETYSDLESFGTSEMGWKHLKTVVRVHGVEVISDTIEDGFLDANIASALVMLCVHTSFPDDAERLLTSLLKGFVYPDPKSPQSHFRDDPTMLPLLTLEKFVTYTERASYYHRQVTDLITSGSLSVTWLGTKHFASIWTSLFRSFSTDPFDRDATTFMTSVLPLLCGAQSSSFGKHEHLSSDQTSMLSVLDTTLATVLMTLIAMSMLSDSHIRNISHILKSTIIDGQLVSSELHGHGGTLIAIANLLVGVEADDDASFVKELVRILGTKPCQLWNLPGSNDRIPTFIYSVARCCGRGSSGDGFEHLKIILERLMAYASLGTPEGAFVLEQLVVDSAFVFADHRPDPKHVQYAQHIREHAKRSFIHPEASPSKCRANSENEFRWEEGINEWVMATPAIRLRGGQELGLSSADEDSDCETPIRLVQKRHKLRTALHARGRVHSNRHSRVSDLAPESPKEYSEDSSWLIGKDYLNDDGYLRAHNSSREFPKLTRPGLSRRPATKSRRLGCELLCSSQNCVLFDHSDDELNAAPPTSSDPARDVFLELPNSMRCCSNVPQRKNSSFHKPRKGWGEGLQEQGEDELGL
jgi:hypothetical protein